MNQLPAAFYSYCLPLLDNPEPLRELLKAHRRLGPRDVQPEVSGTLWLRISSDDSDVVEHCLAFHLANGSNVAKTSFKEALAVSRNLERFTVRVFQPDNEEEEGILWTRSDWNQIGHFLRSARHFAKFHFYHRRPCPARLYELVKQAGLLCTTLTMPSYIKRKELTFLKHQLHLGAVRKLEVPYSILTDFEIYGAILPLFFKSNSFNYLKVSGPGGRAFHSIFWYVMSIWTSYATPFAKKTIEVHFLEEWHPYTDHLKGSMVALEGRLPDWLWYSPKNEARKLKFRSDGCSMYLDFIAV